MNGGGIHLGPRVVALVAALALATAAVTAHRYALLALLGPLALLAILAAVPAVARRHGTPLLAPTGTLHRYVRRRRQAGHAEGLFPLLCPGAAVTGTDVDGRSVGTIADAHGLVAILELGDPRATVQAGPLRVPPVASLTTPVGAAGPPVTAQILIVARGPYQRVFAVLRASGGAWRDAQLREALAGAVRRALRRLARLGTPARPLDPRATAAAVVWAVDAMPGTTPADITEEWDHLRISGTPHVTLRAAGTPTDLPVRLTHAPATTVAIAATVDAVTLRLSAPTPILLATAVAALLSDLPGLLVPCDGDQYPGLRATLPLAGVPAVRPGRSAPRRPEVPPIGAAAGPPAGIGVDLPRGGILIGVDRTGRPVHLRLDQDRPAPVRIAVVGGPGAARVLGARLRAAAASGGLPAVPVAVSVPEPLTAADAATLSGADVVICQPLSEPDAALVAATLHLSRAGSWLSRIEGDMIAVISDGMVRWVRLAAGDGPAAVEWLSRSGLAGLAVP